MTRTDPRTLLTEIAFKDISDWSSSSRHNGRTNKRTFWHVVHFFVLKGHCDLTHCVFSHNSIKTQNVVPELPHILSSTSYSIHEIRVDRDKFALLSLPQSVTVFLRIMKEIIRAAGGEKKPVLLSHEWEEDKRGVEENVMMERISIKDSWALARRLKGWSVKRRASAYERGS